jgi:hypothetical protein
MEHKDKHAEKIGAYEESCTENLTLNDALILIIQSRDKFRRRQAQMKVQLAFEQ